MDVEEYCFIVLRISHSFLWNYIAITINRIALTKTEPYLICLLYQKELNFNVTTFKVLDMSV